MCIMPLTRYMLASRHARQGSKSTLLQLIMNDKDKPIPSLKVDVDALCEGINEKDKAILKETEAVVNKRLAAMGAAMYEAPLKEDGDEELSDRVDPASFYEDLMGEDDDDEEADFDPGDDSSGESEAEDEGALLNGTLHLSDEGRLIWSGTWCMQSEYNQNNEGKKRPKFKLRSQEVFCSLSSLDKLEENGDGENTSSKRPPQLFDFDRPTLTTLTKNGSTPLPSRRTILFDGFFLDKSEEGKKIKERDVEVFFQHENNGYAVTGRGYNGFGPFTLSGTYAPDANSKVLNLLKTYGSGGNAKDTNVARGSKRRAEADSEDEEVEYEEKAGYEELFELTEDANLSVEELRRKYYGGGGGGDEKEGDGGGGKLPAKKQKLEESDDSECGF